MRELRTIKSETEVSLISEACNITRLAFDRVLKTLKPGMMEFEVEAAITYEFIKQGGRGHAYEPIIATGINACSLHYTITIKRVLTVIFYSWISVLNTGTMRPTVRAPSL